MGLLAWPGRTVRSSNGSTLGAHLHDTCDDMDKTRCPSSQACPLSTCPPCFPRSPDRNKAPQMQFAVVLPANHDMPGLSGARPDQPILKSRLCITMTAQMRWKPLVLFFGSRHGCRIYGLACLSRRPSLPLRKHQDHTVNSRDSLMRG